MKRMISFLKQFRIVQVLTVLVAGFALLLTTACNPSSNLQGARPNNPPVQMGGQNNPYKVGGDGYTNYKMSTDPKVNRDNATRRGDRAALPTSMEQLIASHGVDSNAAQDLLYPGSNAKRSGNPDVGPVGPADQAELNKDAFEAPAQPQRVINRSNPNEKILEKIGEEFKEASEFITDEFKGQAENPGRNIPESIKRP